MKVVFNNHESLAIDNIALFLKTQAAATALPGIIY